MKSTDIDNKENIKVPKKRGRKSLKNKSNNIISSININLSPTEKNDEKKINKRGRKKKLTIKIQNLDTEIKENCKLINN